MARERVPISADTDRLPGRGHDKKKALAVIRQGANGSRNDMEAGDHPSFPV
jgi:hypothetical protein